MLLVVEVSAGIITHKDSSTDGRERAFRTWFWQTFPKDGRLVEA